MATAVEVIAAAQIACPKMPLIRETLQDRKTAVAVQKPAKAGQKRALAASEALIIDALRKGNGRFSGPQRMLAEQLQIPLSTLNAALRRLDRKVVRREKKTLVLAAFVGQADAGL